MYNVVFLHPPVSFKKLIYPLGGLFEAATGTTDLLTMMPVGMLSLANELHEAGMKTAIVNVAKKLQELRERPGPSVEEFLAQFPAAVYAIDLHWAAHTPGAIELARMCKAKHPESFVLFGGLTASYFMEEILRSYPFVDGVVRGECDGHMPAIAKALTSTPRRPDLAPNLAYRDGPAIRTNALHKPDLTRVNYIDTAGLVQPAPAKGRLDREAVALNLPIVRGCCQECLFCGGSQSAYQSFFGRPAPDVVPAEHVLEQIRKAVAGGARAVKLFGDVRLGGEAYNRQLLAGLRSFPKKLDLAIEIFWPATREFLADWREAAHELCLSFSPESSHPDIRTLHGKTFDNEAMLQLARTCQELDILAWFWFVYLQPGHTRRRLAQELEFMKKLMAVGPTVAANIQPYLFLDPGSKIFERPQDYGFSVLWPTLAQHRAGIERAYWLFAIGYRTGDFTELDFHGSILDTTLSSARMYFDAERLSARDLLKTHWNVACNREMGRMLSARPDMPDAEIQQQIERIFPPFLRKSNSSLLVWPFLGGMLAPQTSPESMVHDAFPTVLELAVRMQPPGAEAEIHTDISRWIAAYAARLAEWCASPQLAPEIADLAIELLRPLSLPREFALSLIDFEWDVYRLLYFPKPTVSGHCWDDHLVVKPCAYDLISIEEVVAAVAGRDRHPLPLPVERHWCTFNLARRNVLCTNFDPVQIAAGVENARIRRMSSVERYLVRAEPTVLRLLGTLLGQANPNKPVELCRGERLSSAQIREILDPGVPPPGTTAAQRPH